MDIRKIGVVGAGQMGGGIAQVAAQAGYNVTLADSNPKSLEKAPAAMEKSLGKLAEKGVISKAEAKAALARVTTTGALSALADCQLVIEAATENEAVKAKIFKELDKTLPAESLLASNTSSISITRLASYTSRPEKFMGMHFMNPVPLMKLVEVIRGLATDDDTCDTILAVTEKMGKVAAPADDMPGFLVNRVLMPMINEAVDALAAGVADVETIDQAMVLGTGQPMGPLTLADLIGLDTCHAIMTVLQTELDSTRYRPSALLKKYVDAGWLGRKAGKGFYDYSQIPPRPVNPSQKAGG